MKSKVSSLTHLRKANWPLLGGIIGLALATTFTARAGTDEKDMSPSSSAAAPDNSIWAQQYLLGDWGGERTRLAQQGITFDLDDIGDFQADVTGSQTHHATYFGRIRGSVDIDFQRLDGFDGEFFATGIWQYGRNLSGDYLHVNTLTSSIAGEESERIDQFWYQQGLFDNMFKIKLGQLAAVNEFGATDFFDILFNDELGYAPNAVFNTRQPFSPAGKPGIILWGDLSGITPGLYVKTGVFTAYDNPYRPDSNGVYYYDDFNHGMSGAFEFGYNEQKTVYNGVYKLGVNATPTDYMNPATGEEYHGDYNIYGTVEKTVYHPYDSSGKLDTKKGLDLLFQAYEEPGDRNPIQYEFTTGGRYTGLIPGRDEDKVGFGLIYSDNGIASSEAYRATNGHGLGGETTLELDYQYNPAPWLSIQPDVQNIIDPGGDTNRSDIVVLGLRTIVRF
jgi:porin